MEVIELGADTEAERSPKDVLFFLFRTIKVLVSVTGRLDIAINPSAMNPQVPSIPRWKIWKRGFTLKPHQIFSVHTTPEEFENSTITGDFKRFEKFC